jgi:hypothetical protein
MPIVRVQIDHDGKQAANIHFGQLTWEQTGALTKLIGDFHAKIRRGEI